MKPKCSSPFVMLAFYRPKTCDTFSFGRVLKVQDSQGKEIVLMGDTNCNQLCDDTKDTMCRLLKALYKEYQLTGGGEAKLFLL